MEEQYCSLLEIFPEGTSVRLVRDHPHSGRTGTIRQEGMIVCKDMIRVWFDESRPRQAECAYAKHHHIQPRKEAQ